MSQRTKNGWRWFKQILFMLLAFVSSNAAAAAWVEVSETVGAFVYIDRSTIRKNGDLRRVAVIQDLKKRNPNGHLSMRALDEYDCKEARLRSLSLATHSEQMAAGRILWSRDTPGEWIHVAPDTPTQKIFRIVCAR